MRYTPRLPETNVNVSPGSPLKDFAWMLGGLAAVVLVVYVALGFAVDLIAPHVSHDMEMRIAGMMGEHPLVRRTKPAPEALQKLAERVRLAATDIPAPVRVRVLDAPMLNAFALPGGTLVLTTGILKAMDSENELVYILGHELGHVAHRDHLRALGRGLVLMALSSLVLDGHSGPGAAMGGMVRLTDMSFSRRQETRADEAGQDALMALFGHVGGAVDVMEKLASVKGGSWLLRLGASHPDTRARIRHLEDRAAKLGYPEDTQTPMPPALAAPPAADGGPAPAPASPRLRPQAV